MANTKISALPTATTVGAADLIPIVQGGVTKQATHDLLPLSAAQTAALAAAYETHVQARNGAGTAARGRGWRTWDARLADPTLSPNLFIFGHSIVSGYGSSNPATKGFTALLQDQIPTRRAGLGITAEGHSGATSAQLLAALPSATMNALPAGSVGGAMFLGMVNDYYGGTPSTTTQANITAIVAALRNSPAAAPSMTVALVAEWQVGATDGATEPWANYVAAAAAVTAADPDVVLIDAGTRFGDPMADVAGIFYTDHVHLNDRGYALLAATLAGELLHGQQPSAAATAPAHTAIPALLFPLAETGWAQAPWYDSGSASWVVQSDGTQGAERTYQFEGDAGTYTIAVVMLTASNCGRYSLHVDGVDYSGAAGNLDGYNATLTPAFKYIAGFVLTASGHHTLRMVMADKNAASSGYQAYLQGVFITRTSA